MMQLYRVTDTSDPHRSLVLRDPEGAHHVGRSIADLPRIGSELRGPHATLGFHLLIGTAPSSVFRVIFEWIDCGERSASEYAADRPAGPALLLPSMDLPLGLLRAPGLICTCGECEALDGEARATAPHPALQLTHRRRAGGLMKDATLFFNCRVCDADLRCASDLLPRGGWGITRRPSGQPVTR